MLCVERAANSSRRELVSKWTSVFGGHVDEGDKDGVDPWQTILNGVVREVREELGLSIHAEAPKFAGLAIDPTNRTGRLHLGLLFYHVTQADQLHLTLDLDIAEFNISCAQILHFFSAKEVYHVQDRFDP
ncbi:MAG: hypothetical protein JOZ72_19715 [Alphaproteobacteria bacterium]|nr:hypothetical protein [Alphaproteobacteria bacterium]